MSQKSVPVLNLNNSKNIEQKDKIRCLLKPGSCSYLMVHARLKWNFFIKARGVAKM